MEYDAVLGGYKGRNKLVNDVPDLQVSNWNSKVILAMEFENTYIYMLPTDSV